jgi:hypothetical protein
MTDSRSKGNRAEREIAKKLELWWRQFEKDVRFCRTPLSGGFSTSQVRGEFNLSGDLMSTSDLFPFSVEIKRRENWTLKCLISGNKSPIWGWWRQNLKASKEVDKQPMLWFRKNDRAHRRSDQSGLISSPVWFVMIPAKMAEQIAVKVLKRSNIYLVPFCKWSPCEIKSNVDYGGVLPVIFFDYQLLAQSPEVYLP